MQHGSSVLIAQLTDTHVVDPDTDEELYVDNNGRVVEAIASINGESPPVDAVLATGDLTQWGTPTEFAQLSRFTAVLRPPILPLAGNHDDRDRVRACFPSVPWVDADHASWVVMVEHVRVIGLDSTRPGEPGAEFDRVRERWLRSVLAEPHDGPTVLAMHHPPFVTGIDWMDSAGFVGLDRFVSVLAETTVVYRIQCGHLHRPMSSMVGGALAEVGLATTVHVALDVGPDAPVRVVRDPVGYRLLRISGDSIVGHTRYIATGETPFTPSWAVGRA